MLDARKVQSAPQWFRNYCGVRPVWRSQAEDARVLRVRLSTARAGVRGEDSLPRR